MFTSIVDSKFTRGLSFFADLGAIISIVWFIAQFLGIAPGEIVFQKKSAIKPRILLYEGSTIRIGSDLKNNLSSSDFKKINWSLSKSNIENNLNFDGLDQDLTLAPGMTGNLRLKLEVVTFNDEKYAGEYSFQVLNAKPKKIKLSEDGLKVDESAEFKFKPGDEVELVESDIRVAAKVIKTDGGTYIKPDNKNLKEYSTYEGRVFVSLRPKLSPDASINSGAKTYYPKPAAISLDEMNKK